MSFEELLTQHVELMKRCVALEKTLALVVEAVAMMQKAAEGKGEKK